MHLPPLTRSLSARLLVLTVFFVMVSEFLIYAPSIGRFRLAWLEERMAAGHLAGLAVDATPDRRVSQDLAAMLLHLVGAHTVDLYRGRTQTHMLADLTQPLVEADFDLRQAGFFSLIGDAFMTLGQSEGRIIRVIGPSPKDPDILVDVVLDETPLRAAMFDYSERILGLSIVISLITAGLVFLSLQVLMVAPMRRITQSMVAFRGEPERPWIPTTVTRRKDELGVAERELAILQDDLRAALRQKEHLAGLGTAVSKISHDLRNILSTVRLLSDRLADSTDPEVKRITPALVAAVDRAVNLCAATLDFSADRPRLMPSRFDLAGLVAELAGDPAAIGKLDLINTVPQGLAVTADRDQLFRVFSNLARNADRAGAKRMTVTAELLEGAVSIEVADDGPGVAASVQPTLFQPFTRGRPGSTGLGLAIARDLMVAHGGSIDLAMTGPAGTRFHLSLPDAAGGAG
ncbi:MAG: HAMP domain-containing histidine kinase [Proteobacteria bacterium]|nr:HAMP domain-containing histidine kinase [Pseudomonadota bacterium]MBI3499686.1 HAMP domain-containing histidine kinase [Pseudomonadota bacterium]